MIAGKVYWLHLKNHTRVDREGYIGVTTNIDARLEYHFRTLRHASHCNPRLQAAYNKYRDEIVSSLLFDGLMEECVALEKKLRPDKEIGWNLLEGGGFPPMQKNIPWFTNGITNIKAAECPDGFWRGKTQKDGGVHGLAGRPKSPDHRIRLSNALRGRRLTEEHVRNAANGTRGKVKNKKQCPVCGIIGGGGAMHRWHFDRCRAAL